MPNDGWEMMDALMGAVKDDLSRKWGWAKQDPPPREPDLLPCPCCGGIALFGQWLDTLDPNATWIECTTCELMTDSVHHEDPIEAMRLAAAIWNKRVPNNADVVDFYNRVCAMAEEKIMMTHKLEGAHYASMRQLIEEYR